MSSNHIKTALLFLIISIGAFSIVNLFQSSMETKHFRFAVMEREPSQIKIIKTTPATKRGEKPSEAPKPKSKPTSKNTNEKALENWKKVSKKMGNLHPTFSDEGYLVSLRGKPGSSSHSDSFDMKDPQSAIRRAKEFLAELAPSIGIDQDLSTLQTVAKTSPNSVQVYFQQVIGRIPIEPAGSVVIDMDKEGELVGMDSSYLPGAEVTNEFRLSSSEAQERALVAYSKVDKSVGNNRQPSQNSDIGGRQILWKLSQDSQTRKFEIRKAYEFHVNGRQIIIDGESGRVLAQRDRRLF